MVTTHRQHRPGPRTVFLCTGFIRKLGRKHLATRRAAQLLQLIAQSGQQGVAVKAYLHPRRYRIQTALAAHRTAFTDSQLLMTARNTLGTLIRSGALPPLARAMTATHRCPTASVFLARFLGATLCGGELFFGRARLLTTVWIINARPRRWLCGRCGAKFSRLSKEHHTKPLETEFGLLQGTHQPKMPPQHVHHHAPIVGRPPLRLDPLDQCLTFFSTQRRVLGPFHRGRSLETPR